VWTQTYQSPTFTKTPLAGGAAIESGRIDARRAVQEIVWVALGGGAGSAARYLVGRVFGPEPAFPWGTFIVNTTGSLAAGLLVGFFATRISGNLRLGLLVGFLGGFTTFSSFALESAGLLRGGQPVEATMNLVGSVVIGLVAALIGLAIGESVAS